MGESLSWFRFKACRKCQGDLVFDQGDWLCLQCGRYYYTGLNETQPNRQPEARSSPIRLASNQQTPMGDNGDKKDKTVVSAYPVALPVAGFAAALTTTITADCSFSLGQTKFMAPVQYLGTTN